MVETVFLFAFVSALFEFVILMKLSPRTRLKLLGSPKAVALTHFFVVSANLIIHFGTITGSMTAITAGLASFITIPFARMLCGRISNNMYYPGVIRYTGAQLR